MSTLQAMTADESTAEALYGAVSAAEGKNIRPHVFLVDGHRITATTSERLADEKDQLVGGLRIDGQERRYSVEG